MNFVTTNSNFAQLSIFSALGTNEMEQILNRASVRKIEKNVCIYYPGDSTETVYFVKQGRVKISGHYQDDKEIIKEVLYSGEMFGETGIFGENKRRDSAIAVDHDVEIYAMDVRILKEIMRTHPQINVEVNSRLYKKIKTIENRLEALMYKKSRTRIIDFLQRAASERFKMVGDEILIKPFLTHTDIAKLTDTSRQTVTLVLNELKKKNLIYFDRKRLLIRDLAMLK